MNHPILHGIASIHTPRVGRDLLRIFVTVNLIEISIHTPRVGRDNAVPEYH